MLEPKKIYIICTHSEGGRFINTASTSYNTALGLYYKIVAGYRARGFEPVEEKTAAEIEQPDAFLPGRPWVSLCYCLRNPAGVWFNVEYYEIVEPQTNEYNANEQQQK